MVSITIKEVSNNLPSYLQRVQAGESFVIVEAGKPVAKVVPPKSEPMSDQGIKFLESLAKFRARIEAEGIDLDSDEIFKDVRDRSPAPEEPRW